MQSQHRDERKNDGDGQSDDGDQCRAYVPEKNYADQRHDDAFFDQFFAQRGDGIFDQGAAVVSRNNFHARRQRGFYLLEFLFDAINHRQRIFAVTHDHDAADHFTFAVQFSHSPPQVRAEVNRADILDIHRRAIDDLERDVFQISEALDVTAPANVILGRTDLENLSANIIV